MPRKYDPDALFAIYYGLGVTRSHARVRATLVAVGARAPAVNTVSEYAVRFRWTERVAELDRQAEAASSDGVLGSVLEANARHVSLARALQGVALTGIRNVTANDPRLEDESIASLSRTADIGIKAERLALGQATDRREVAVTVINEITVAIVALFVAIEDYEPAERRRRFVEGMDVIQDGAVVAALEHGEGSS